MTKPKHRPKRNIHVPKYFQYLSPPSGCINFPNFPTQQQSEPSSRPETADLWEEMAIPRIVLPLLATLSLLCTPGWTSDPDPCNSQVKTAKKHRYTYTPPVEPAAHRPENLTVGAPLPSLLEFAWTKWRLNYCYLSMFLSTVRWVVYVCARLFLIFLVDQVFLATFCGQECYRFTLYLREDISACNLSTGLQRRVTYCRLK